LLCILAERTWHPQVRFGAPPDSDEGSSRRVEPIRKESLADAVSDRVLALIREGTYRAGDRLPTERELAGQLGVGRTSVREGLRYLEKLGVLDIHQGRGMMVRSLSLEDVFLNSMPVSTIVELLEKQIRDIMHARRVLELESARLAASARTAEDLARMADLVEAQKRNLERPEEWLALDGLFHVAVARASDNEALVQLIRLLWDMLFKHSEAILRNEIIITSSTSYHEQIYNAIEAGDAGTARERMLAHLEDSQKLVLAGLFSTDHAPGEPPPDATADG
jgi:GntR family transcriptional regulator, transcriptional repressor for pyruvate dehydrogenase complex